MNPIDLGLNLPQRKQLSWSNQKFDYCGCGRWAGIVDGQCAECHDADYEVEKEAAYQKRIRELMEENSKLRGQKELLQCRILLLGL